MTRLFIVTGALEGTGETYERLVAIEYFTLPALAMVTGLFIDALLPRPWLRRFVLSWGVGLGSLLILFSLMADIALLTSTLHFYQLYLVPFFILLGGHLILRLIVDTPLVRGCSWRLRFLSEAHSTIFSIPMVSSTPAISRPIPLWVSY